MINQRLCPETEYAPATAEGLFVAETLDRWGIWRRAGMAGTIVGMDIAEAMRGVPPGCDREFCERLFVTAESAFCAAAVRMTEQQRTSIDEQR